MSPVERIRYAIRFAATVAAHRKLAGSPRFVVDKGLRLRLGSGATVQRGRGLVIRRNVTITVEGRLVFGEQVFINEGCYLSVMDSITIGDRVRLGERVSVHDQNHLFEPLGAVDPGGYSTAPIEIGADVWIGANAVILPGAKIGNNTVVAANSVVRGVIPAGVLAAGAPAHIVRRLTVAGEEDS